MASSNEIWSGIQFFPKWIPDQNANVICDDRYWLIRIPDLSRSSYAFSDDDIEDKSRYPLFSQNWMSSEIMDLWYNSILFFIVKVPVMQCESDLYSGYLRVFMNKDWYTMECACVIHEICLTSLCDFIYHLWTESMSVNVELCVTRSKNVMYMYIYKLSVELTINACVGDMQGR